MTETTSAAHAPAPAAEDRAPPTPQSAAAQHVAADQASQLDYATPWPIRGWAPSVLAHPLFWRAVRKTVLAGGLGLLAYGIASVAGGVNRHVAPVAAAWGILFIALMLPAPHLRRRKRKKRRRNGGTIPGKSQRRRG